MQTGGDNSWFLYLPKYLLFLTLLMFMEQKYSFLCIFLQCFAINRSKMDVDIIRFFLLLLLRMCIIGPCSKIILFPIGNLKMGNISIFSFEVCPPPPQPKPNKSFYWRNLLYIYTIYVSEKLGLSGSDIH